MTVVVGAQRRLLDHTMLDTAERCEEEAYFRYALNLDSSRPAAAPLFGQAVHAGVRQFYRLPTDVDAATAACAAQWGSATFEAKEWRTLDYAQTIVAAYATVYPPEQWDFQLVMNEQYLADDTECGIVDRVVRRKADGQLYTLDLKTTGLWLGPAWQEQWRHSQQAARYLKLVEQVVGQAVAGFWCDAIYLHKRGYPKPEDFVRAGPFSYSRELRAELDAQRRVKGARLQAVLDGSVLPVKNTRNCFRFNALCPFLRFCVADPAERPDMLDLALATGELIEKEWRPAER